MITQLDRHPQRTHGHARPAAPQRVIPRRRRQMRRGLVAIAVTLVAAIAGDVALAVHRDDTRRNYLNSSAWPIHGQAALQIGDWSVQTSPDQHPVPIASVAKVMTAYLVLRTRPAADRGADEPTLHVSADDVADTERRRHDGESVIDVQAGETLTEHQALLGLLLPSANNLAVMLARWSEGSVSAFVDEMNRTAARLGMRHTHYTDPSGLDEQTVSTARDQLVLADAAMGNREFADLVSQPEADLPVAGRVHNTDHLLGHDGFVGIKTGSDDAAAGCFVFRTRRVVDGAQLWVTGVVLGQRGHNLITAALTAARQLADRAAPVVP